MFSFKLYGIRHKRLDPSFTNRLKIPKLPLLAAPHINTF